MVGLGTSTIQLHHYRSSNNATKPSRARSVRVVVAVTASLPRENRQVNVKDSKQVADALRELLEQIDAGEVAATDVQVAFIRGALSALP